MAMTVAQLHEILVGEVPEMEVRLVNYDRRQAFEIVLAEVATAPDGSTVFVLEGKELP